MLSKRFVPIFLYFLLSNIFLMAQEISPRGGFLSDSIKLGEPVVYTLSIKYPRSMQLIFPDSSYNFFPFEYSAKVVYPTKSDDQYSYDSVAYRLSSFELDKVQTLAVPVFILTDGDSLPVFANADSVFLKELIQVASDTIAIKKDTNFREVSTGLNYPYIIAAILGLLVFVVGTYLLFGKMIYEKYKLYKLKKAHARFTRKYNQQLEELESNSGKNPEEVLLLWKKYMEDLENRPYTKQTSKEIVINTDSEPLRNSLRSIDRSIYGEFRDQNLIDSFQYLSEYSEDRFNKKIQEVTHG